MPQVSLVHGMFVLLSGILAGSSNTALASWAEVGDGRGYTHPAAPLVTECPTCALFRLGSVGPPDMVEAVKRHILNMLRLEERPNVTQPIPRAALLNAIKKLHVGRVAKDGTVELENDSRSQAEMQELAAQTSEVITFAEAGGSPDTMSFQISREGGELSLVEQASVWLFLKLNKNNRSRARVTIRLVQWRMGPNVEEATVAQKVVDTRRSGWHTLPVSESVQALLSMGRGTLVLRAVCEKCAEVGATLLLAGSSERAQSHRPFLVAVVRQAGDRPHQRRKRGLECDGKIRICCKKHFYVNFKDIGWNDWIIAPPGYHANYCEGDCPSHVAGITGSSLSFHSTVINHYRMRGYSPFTNIKSCCVPTRLRAMSMLYYNEEQKIVKKDIQNMIVEECGCS